MAFPLATDATAFISHYGYWALLLGTLLEGETILIAAGYAAHQGLLQWPLVILIAALGGTLGDQCAFTLGRWRGEKLIRTLSSRASVISRLSRLQRALGSYDVLAIILVRFMYGLRLIGPIFLGTCPISPGRFGLFNALGAGLWACSISATGYYSASLGEVAQDQWGQPAGWIVGAGLVAIVIWVVRKSSPPAP